MYTGDTDLVHVVLLILFKFVDTFFIVSGGLGGFYTTCVFTVLLLLSWEKSFDLGMNYY